MTYSSLATHHLSAPRARIAVKAYALPQITQIALMGTLACLLGLLYLVQVTHTNAYGYKLADVQSQVAALNQEHDDLVLQSARLQSLDRVKAYADTAGLVSVTPR